MEHYLHLIQEAYSGYADYLWKEITFGYDYKPWYANYFYGLLLVSAIFLVFEWLTPWRPDQPKFRRDFWLDFFYMFFNFFLFSLVFYNALSEVVVHLFRDWLAMAGLRHLTAIQVEGWPVWVQWLVLFVVRDFVQWNVHRLLHRVPWLWEFHKLHHSVRQMGFAAHLRYHWMETIVYRGFEYLPLAMIGFGIDDFFVVHMFALTIGHANHANIDLPLGPLCYLLNSPQMHIWHHARHLPAERAHGVNFGISLSLWDYIFGTNYQPYDGRDIELGFEGVERYPAGFWDQLGSGFRRSE